MEKEYMEYHRQAVIIIAHQGFDQLKSLIELLTPVFEVYVHINKRTPRSEWERFGFEQMQHVKVFSLYKINWGGSNFLKAILYLMNEALKNEKIDYFHIITGEDWPVRNVEEIYQRFRNEKKTYMEFKKLSGMNKKEYRSVSKWQKYYSFLNIFDYKKMPQKIFVKFFVAFQCVMGVNRFKNLEIEMARGVVWGDLPREAVEYCINYLHGNPDFMNYLEYGHASDEFFFQTVLLNSKKWEEKIVNNNLRYIKYERRNGSYPAILDERDMEGIQSGDYIFARKVRMPVSEKIIHEINYIYENEGKKEK